MTSSVPEHWIIYQISYPEGGRIFEASPEGRLDKLIFKEGIVHHLLVSQGYRIKQGWHRSMKNQILLHHYYLPSELEEQLQRFVSYYNHERYHESLNNLTPVDVFCGCGQEILEQRALIKQNTLVMRRLCITISKKLITQQLDELMCLLYQATLGSKGFDDVQIKYSVASEPSFKTTPTV